MPVDKVVRFSDHRAQWGLVAEAHRVVDFPPG
jgi:hypothetical protein